MSEKIEKEENAKEQPQNAAVLPPVFKVIKQMLLYKEYNSREEVLAVSANMVRIAKERFDNDIAEIYADAYERLSRLTYEQMCALMEVLTPDEEMNG